MADDQSPKRRDDLTLDTHPLVSRLGGEDDEPPSLVTLVGYLGPSKKADSVRLYADLTFRTYYEVPRAGIQSSEAGPDENSPTRLAVRSDTRLEIVQTTRQSVEASYLSGAISGGFLGAAAPGRPPACLTVVTANPTDCGPICPTYVTANPTDCGPVCLTVLTANPTHCGGPCLTVVTANPTDCGGGRGAQLAQGGARAAAQPQYCITRHTAVPTWCQPACLTVVTANPTDCGPCLTVVTANPTDCGNQSAAFAGGGQVCLTVVTANPTDCGPRPCPTVYTANPTNCGGPCLTVVTANPTQCGPCLTVVTANPTDCGGRSAAAAPQACITLHTAVPTNCGNSCITVVTHRPTYC